MDMSSATPHPTHHFNRCAGPAWLAALCIGASGCGGGGTTTELGVPVYTVEGRWTDQDQRGIAGATVAVQLDRLYSTTTRDDGSYKLEIPQDYAYPTYFAGYIKKAGYLPTPIYFNWNNKSYNASATTRSATDADVVFTSGIEVTHLGDDSFSGSANSQLQVAAQGIVWSESFTLSAAQKAKFQQLCLLFAGRGVQSTDSRDFVHVSKASLPGTFEYRYIGDSDANGAYSNFRECFRLDRFSSSDSMTIGVTSGNNDGKRNDRDDFEITNVIGRLE